MLELWDRLNFHARRIKLEVQNSDIVLDVGSGNRPNPRADVLCDLYAPGADFHRQGQQLILDDRPTILADIRRLPFQDKAFDFVIASHVLEHVPHIEDAIRELSRVAKSGYIETPSAAVEMIFMRPEHVWLVEEEENCLVFTSKKTLQEIPGSVARILKMWREAIELRPQAWWKFYFQTARFWTVRFLWKDQIKYRVAVAHGDVDHFETTFDGWPKIPEAGSGWSLTNLLYWSGKKVIIQWHNYGRRQRAQNMRLFQLLECPTCGGSVGYGIDKEIRCERCGTQYRGDGRMLNFVPQTPRNPSPLVPPSRTTVSIS